MKRERDAYLATAETAEELIASEAVASSWHKPSALKEFRVSGLAGHLARQLLSTRRFLQSGDHRPIDAEPVDAVGYYEGHSMADQSLDSLDHVANRQRGEDEAAAGPEDLARAVHGARLQLETLLASWPEDRLVYIPDGTAMRLQDHLRVRIVELVVHIDDLAVSVGSADYPISENAMQVAAETLVQFASARHGLLPVIRALSRTERSPQPISAF